MTDVHTEKRRRICVALWAYAYESKAHSIVSDAVFDVTAKEIDTTIKTGNVILDTFFEIEFSSDTGQWIHKHPELDKVSALYNRLFKV